MTSLHYIHEVKCIKLKTVNIKILTVNSLSSFSRHRMETFSSSIWYNPCTNATNCW